MNSCNNWSALGVLQSEPKLIKISDGKVMARAVLVCDAVEGKTYIPIAAFNKKAHVLTALAHRGSIIYATGSMYSTTQITSKKGKTLVGITFKLNDFVVLVKEPIKTSDEDFADVVQMYDPDNFMEDSENAE